MKTTPVFAGLLFVMSLVSPGPAHSSEDPQADRWRYTTEDPGTDWTNSGFDDALWKRGSGGFGSRGVPGGEPSTSWTTPEIWLRKSVTLANDLKEPALWIHHDEDAEVYWNGRPIAEFRGYLTAYELVPLPDLPVVARTAGEHLLAVHCRQTGGGQYIDVALVDASTFVVPEPAAEAPVVPTLKTRWASEIDPERPLPEHPRPRLVRDERWVNLNGSWQYAIRGGDRPEPVEYDGTIVVPFPVESQLSGVVRRVEPGQKLWYRRTFRAPDLDDGERLLLHFGAVDWHATVAVNGQVVGEHWGGYTPFSFDITDALINADEQTLLVRVEDPTNQGVQPRGKQTLDPGGIYYTAVTGIWQTVWLEPVPGLAITDVSITADPVSVTPEDEDVGFRIAVDLEGGSTNAGALTVRATLLERSLRGELVEVDDSEATGSPDTPIRLPIAAPKLWTPDEPWLYEIRVELLDGDGEVLDAVTTDSALRSNA